MRYAWKDSTEYSRVAFQEMLGFVLTVFICFVSSGSYPLLSKYHHQATTQIYSYCYNTFRYFSVTHVLFLMGRNAEKSDEPRKGQHSP